MGLSKRLLIIIGKTNKILFFDIFNQKIKKQLTFLHEEKTSFYEFEQLNVLFRVLYKQKNFIKNIFIQKVIISKIIAALDFGQFYLNLKVLFSAFSKSL